MSKRKFQAAVESVVERMHPSHVLLGSAPDCNGLDYNSAVLIHPDGSELLFRESNGTFVQTSCKVEFDVYGNPIAVLAENLGNVAIELDSRPDASTCTGLLRKDGQHVPVTFAVITQHNSTPSFGGFQEVPTPTIEGLDYAKGQGWNALVGSRSPLTGEDKRLAAILHDPRLYAMRGDVRRGLYGSWSYPLSLGSLHEFPELSRVVECVAPYGSQLIGASLGHMPPGSLLPYHQDSNHQVAVTTEGMAAITVPDNAGGIRRFPVRAGDVVHFEPGTPHAVQAGRQSRSSLVFSFVS